MDKQLANKKSKISDSDSNKEDKKIDASALEGNTYEPTESKPKVDKLNNLGNFEGREDEFASKVLIIGVGGCGCNLVCASFNEDRISDKIEYVSINTDHAHLKRLSMENRILIGRECTKGQGAGSDPDIGRKAAEEDEESLRAAIEDYNMIVILAGMGGGTGTGAAPVIARIANEEDVVVLVITTMPFENEGKLRMKQAEEGLSKIKEYANSVIVIPNQNIITTEEEYKIDPEFDYEDYEKPNAFVKKSVNFIRALIAETYIINTDFADVRSVMLNKGVAIVGFGDVEENSDVDNVVKEILHHPLLDKVELSESKGALVNIIIGKGTPESWIDKVLNTIMEAIDPSGKVKIIPGRDIDPNLNRFHIKISILITGIGSKKKGKIIDKSAQGEMFSSDKNKGNISSPGWENDKELNVSSFFGKQAD
jgi:cell division protein FtsZ